MNGKLKHKTFVGVFLTLTQLLTIAFVFYYFFQQYLDTSHPAILTVQQKAPGPQVLNFSKLNYEFKVGLVNATTQRPLIRREVLQYITPVF
jgi:hypothetical protein